MPRVQCLIFQVAGLRIGVRGADLLSDWQTVRLELERFRLGHGGAVDVLVDVAVDHAPVGVERLAENPIEGDRGFAGPWSLELLGSRPVKIRVRTMTAVAVVVAMHVGLAEVLPRRWGVLLHAAAARTGEGIVVFPGPSGAGKTTAVRSFGDDRVVCDERVAVRRRRGSWEAWSVPLWGGKYRPVLPSYAALVLAVVIGKGQPRRIGRLSPAEAVAAVVPAVKWHRRDGESAARVLAVLQDMVCSVPFLEVCCRRQDSVAELVGRYFASGMGGQE